MQAILPTPSGSFLAVCNFLSVNGDQFTRSEKAVLDFLVNRTLRYNKTSENVPMRHMTNGIPKIIAPVGYSRRTIMSALQGLRDKGFIRIFRRKAKGGRVLASRFEIANKMSKLRISKKHRAKESDEGAITAQHKEDIDRSPSSSSFGTITRSSTRAVHALTKGVKDFNKSRRTRNAVRLRGNIETGRVTCAWKHLCLEYGMEAPTFTKAVAGRVTGQLRQVENAIDDPYDFMEWCIQNWNIIKRSEFKKWDFVKPNPDIAVWGYAITQFVGMYQTREFYDKEKLEQLPGTTMHEETVRADIAEVAMYEMKGKLMHKDRMIEALRKKNSEQTDK